VLDRVLQRVKAISQAGPVGEVSEFATAATGGDRKTCAQAGNHSSSACCAKRTRPAWRPFLASEGRPWEGSPSRRMEPLRGTEQSLWSRRVASKSLALPDLRAWQPRAGHNSRKRVGTVVRICRPGHGPRHRRQATIPSRRTPHYPEKRARAPAGASVPVARDEGVKSSCDAACRREQGLPLGRIARGHCNRRSSRNQVASCASWLVFSVAAVLTTIAIFPDNREVIDRTTMCRESGTGIPFPGPGQPTLRNFR
jgi:hypothetical protein